MQLLTECAKHTTIVAAPANACRHMVPIKAIHGYVEGKHYWCYPADVDYELAKQKNTPWEE